MERENYTQLGLYRSVRFLSGQVDPVRADVDLLVVGMPVMGAAGNLDFCELDRALLGTLSQLRAGGIFEGTFGQTMMLDRLPPPFQPCSLLVVGMGDPALLDAEGIGALSALAMQSALRLSRGSVGHMVCIPGQAASPEAVTGSARALMAGMLRTLDTHPAIMRCRIVEYVFDLRSRHADSARDAMRDQLRDWT